MMRVIRLLVLLSAVLVTVSGVAPARAATVRRTDETIVSGTLAQVTDGKLIVTSKSADGKETQTVIPLDDIVQISMEEGPVSAASATQPAPASAPSLPPAARGLTARYYNQQFWKGSDPQTTHAYMLHAPDLTTTVADINFNWENGSPDASIGSDSFSCVFSGKVRTTVAGTYTFLGYSDDDHYLFVNGKLVSSDTGGHTPRDPRSVRPDSVVPLELAGDTEYDFIYLHNENIGGSAAYALWMVPGDSNPSLIPATQFTTRSGTPKPPTDFKVEKSSGTFITLSFKDVATNETRYTIERSGDESFAKSSVVATVGMNATTATDTIVTGGATYYYRVKAQNFEGESTPVTLKATATDSDNQQTVPATPLVPAQKVKPQPSDQPGARGPDEQGWQMNFPLPLWLTTAALAAESAPATSQPAVSENWQLVLNQGDRITGTLLGWGGDHLRVKTGWGELDIPAASIREAWHAEPPRVQLARAVTPADAKGDIAYVERDASSNASQPQVIAVSGSVAGIDGPVLRFRYREQERRIQLARLVGVQVAVESERLDEPSLHQVFDLANGDQISGKWVAIDKDALRIKTLWGQDVSIAKASIKAIRTRNGRLVYLTDLKPAKVEQTPYFDRMMSYQVDKGLNGGVLSLPGKSIEHALAVHSRTVLTYKIDGKFERLRTTAFFEQPDGKQGRAALRIIGDGKPLFERPDARGDQPPIEVDVPMAGVTQLALEVDFGANEDVGDRVVWANPRLLRGSAGAR